MKSKQLRVAAIAILLAGAVGLTACSSSPAAVAVPTGSNGAVDLDALATAAKAEGGLTLYTDGTLKTQQAWADAFTQKYGIPVSIVRDSGAPLYQRFSQEEAAGQRQADVFGNVDPASLDDAVANGWLAQYTPQDASLFPAAQTRPGYYYPYLNGFAHTIAYNPTKVTPAELAEVMSDPVKAMEDPQFKGRIGVCPPQTAQLAQAFWYLYTDGAAKNDVGWDGLAKIAANTSLITDTATLSQDIVQGEVDFAFPVADSIVSSQLAANANAPIRFIYATPTVGGQFGMGVVANAPHPNAARLFTEWAATPEANTLLAQLTGNKPLNTSATDARSYLTADWFKPLNTDTTWYQTQFSKDQPFLDAVGKDGDYLSHWSQVFGYSG
jgi:iron(III) transport system substrate-binding protein